MGPWNETNFVKYILNFAQSSNFSKFDFEDITSNILSYINLNNFKHFKYDLYLSNGILKMKFYRILNISNGRFILVQIGWDDREYRLKEQFMTYSVL